MDSKENVVYFFEEELPGISVAVVIVGDCLLYVAVELIVGL